jgi:putative aldouronate transport system permease protein
LLYRRRLGEYAFDKFNELLMLLLIAVTLIPFLHVVFASFSSSAEVLMNRGIFLWPKGFNLEAYKYALSHPVLIPSFFNTVYYAAAGTIIGLIFMSMAAYAFSKRAFPGKKAFLFLIVFTMFFGGGMIPSYINIRNLGLIDKRLVMIIPACISTWSIIILRTGFKQVPASLSESAYLDGANDFVILFKIIIPLSKAMLAVASLYSIVGYWNSWFPALIYLRDRSKYPLQMVLREIVIVGQMNEITNRLSEELVSYKRSAMEEVIKYATMVLTTGPIILVYPFMQKYFIKGVIVGSLKE